MAMLNNSEAIKNIADSLHSFGLSYEKINVENAIIYYKKAYELRIRTIGDPNHSSIIESLEAIENCYKKMEKFDKSLNFKIKAFETKRFNLVEKRENKFFPSQTTTNSDVNQNDENSLLDLSNVLYQNGVECEKINEYEIALDFFVTSVKIKEFISRGSASHKSKLADSYYAIGNIYYKLKNFKCALENFEKSFNIREHLSEFPNPQKANCLNSIGNVYEKMDNLKKAYKYKINAFEMRKELYSDDHLFIAESLDSIGSCLEKMNTLNTALDYKKRAYAVKLNTYEKNSNQDIANSLNGIGLIYEKLNDLKKSYEYLKQSYLIRLELNYTNDVHELSSLLHNLGVVAERLDYLEEAKEYLEKAVELRRKSNQANPELANSLNSLSVVYFKFFKRSGFLSIEHGRKSIEYSKIALKIRKKIHNYDEYFLDIADSLYNLGVLYENMGCIQTSNLYYQNSLKIRKTLFNQNNHELVQDLLKKLKLKPEKKSLDDWSMNDILKWLNGNKVNSNIIKSLESSQALNIKLLEQFFNLSTNTPELFNQSLLVETNYEIGQTDIDYFRMCLEKLFCKNNDLSKNIKINFII